MRSRWLPLVLAVFVVGSIVAVGVYLSSSSLETRLAAARGEFRRGNPTRALELTEQLVTENPTAIAPREFALQLATELKQTDVALEHAEWLFENSSSDTDKASYGRQVAIRYYESADFNNAEVWFKRVLEVAKDDSSAHARLAAMFTDQGRRWEAFPHLFELIKSNRNDMQHLVLAGRTEDMVALKREYVTQRLARRDQPGPLVGVARFGIVQDEDGIVESLLRDVIKQRPDLLEARIRLCEYLFNKRPGDFVRQMVDMPPEAATHPAFWTLQGRWFRKQRRPELAIGAFAEALRLDPNRYIATFNLGQLLAQAGDAEKAKEFRDRAKRLNTLGGDLLAFLSGRVTEERILSVSDQMLALGRYWESYAWAKYLTTDEYLGFSQKRLRRLTPALKDHVPVVRDDFNPVLRLSKIDWPVPTADDLRKTQGNAVLSTEIEVNHSPIQLTNVAEQQGVRFSYFNGAIPNSEEHRMYEFTGGGVGVIDYDLDGLPDVYLPNGTVWPPSDKSEHLDAFYRNQDGRFNDVATEAGLIESDFGQGVTVGDINCDGFPDLYIANTQQNRLWTNNGDGTFTDATKTAGLNTGVWTTSAAIVDLNADGLPDIYDANFLSGEDVFTRVCNEDGRPRSCPPREFPGEQDRVLFNQGDGTFKDVTETAGVVRPKGNGLGIIVADFENAGRLNVFLANDSVPNFYYQNESTTDAIVLSERATLSGLDVNHTGNAQACMGVGLADIDGNKLPDLFITNFFNESNAMYLQESANLFSDESRETKIRDISLKMLGFGTQFFDVDLNSKPDLLITNGHVDDFTHDGNPYQMRPQVLRHSGTANVQFAEQQPEPTDAYFSGKHLGRGLATLDFNRDGLPDAGISHLDSPFALIQNQTKQHGSFVSFRLVSTRSARDAIGAKVTVTCGDQSFYSQLYAGDGYMASNERRLIIGLGQCTGECVIEVEWMSGEIEAFGAIQANSRAVLVEKTGVARIEPK